MSAWAKHLGSTKNLQENAGNGIYELLNLNNYRKIYIHHFFSAHTLSPSVKILNERNASPMDRTFI